MTFKEEEEEGQGRPAEREWFCRGFDQKGSHCWAVQHKESCTCTFKVLNITAGVSLREVRTAMVFLLLFKIVHSFTKRQQVYLTDGEETVQVFSPVRQRQESL